MSTTTVRAADRSTVIRLLNTLVEVAIDAEKGYAEASADVRDHDLKAELMGRAQDRAGFVRALQKAIAKKGALPENEGTLKGALHRGWIDVRRSLQGRSDQIVLDECHRGELAAKRTYDRALLDVPLDTLGSDVRAVVQGQYSEIVDSLRALEARMRRSEASSS